MTILELADACERAKAADAVLDENIAVAIGWQRPMLPGVCGPNYSGRNRYEWHDRNGQPMGFFPLSYTASLDAAMQLVPDRHKWTLSGDASGSLDFQYEAEVCARNTGLEKPVFSHPCATPALALLAAALRARHAMEIE